MGHRPCDHPVQTVAPLAPPSSGPVPSLWRLLLLLPVLRSATGGTRRHSGTIRGTGCLPRIRAVILPCVLAVIPSIILTLIAGPAPPLLLRLTWTVVLRPLFAGRGGGLIVETFRAFADDSAPDETLQRPQRTAMCNMEEQSAQQTAQRGRSPQATHCARTLGECLPVCGQ